MVFKKKSPHKRIQIYDELFHVLWHVQRGGLEQSAIDYYTRKIESPKFEVEDSETRRASIIYNHGEREAMLWFSDLANSEAIAHEVMHAVIHFSDLLGVAINKDTEEVFTHYHGWLTKNIVKKLW